MKHLFGHRRDLPDEQWEEDYESENWDEESAEGEEYLEEYDDLGEEEEYAEEYEESADEEKYAEEYEAPAEEEEAYAEEEPAYADEEAPEEEIAYEEPAEEEENAKEKGIGQKGIRGFWARLELADRVMIGAAAVVLALVLVTAGIYLNAKMPHTDTETVAEVGTQLDGIDVVGGKGLLAMADAEAARAAAAEAAAAAAQAEMETTEYSESEYDRSVTVVLKTVSVQKDLKIKFVNQKTDKLIPNVPFSVTITDPDGQTLTWSDDDMDGIIYKKDITAGTYKIEVNEIAGTAYAGYTLPTGTESTEVKAEIAYEKIDVSDEVKTESEINTATEEQQNKNIEVESTAEDTVTWVDSTEVSETYAEVAKSNISSPEDVSAGDIESGTVSAEEVKANTTVLLRDKDNYPLYVLEDSTYRSAVFADYYQDVKFFKRGDVKYTGWQTINGKVYYYDASGSRVTGEQTIQGATYQFDSDGALVTSNGTLGIDVSKHNGTIDWEAVKNSGVSYVIIRCGYRGYTQGSLVIDSKFQTNIKGATAAGLKVGVYFFSQAVDEVEAVEEASFVLDCVSGYTISYPIFLDVEYSGSSGNKGRADGLDTATRTAICKAFCSTIQNAGYTAGIYANKTWLESKIDVTSLGSYKIWLAQYAAEATYTGHYDLWQYKATGKISGISGDVDLNLSYLGY